MKESIEHTVKQWEDTQAAQVTANSIMATPDHLSFSCFNFLMTWGPKWMAVLQGRMQFGECSSLGGIWNELAVTEVCSH